MNVGNEYEDEKSKKNKAVSEYIKRNRKKVSEQQLDWKKRNRDAWNSYQRWHRKMSYWKKKLETNPNNEKAIQKLELILKEKQ